MKVNNQSTIIRYRDGMDKKKKEERKEIYLRMRMSIRIR